MLRVEPSRIVFTKYDSTSGDLISALDDQLNNCLTFLEQEFNKKKNVQKNYLTGVVIMGVFQVTMLLHYR